MNERIIKELLVQAGTYDCDPHDPDFKLSDVPKDYLMFAELIVKECQTVVEWAISVDSTIDRVPVLIKEHFGVEE